MALDVLAEPQRRRILDELRDGDRMVGQLSRSLDLAQPSVSKHLKVLREAGLVRVRADAQRRWYGLRLEPLVELDEWLEPYRRLWADRLDALERHLDELEEPQAHGPHDEPDPPTARRTSTPRTSTPRTSTPRTSTPRTSTLKGRPT